MKAGILRSALIAFAVGVFLTPLAGVSAPNVLQLSPITASGATTEQSLLDVAVTHGMPTSAQGESPAPILHIVVFDEAPLVLYDGRIAGLAKPPQTNRAGRATLDLASREAKDYRQYLKERRQARLTEIGQRLGRSLAAKQSFDLSLNAAVIRVSETEARSIRSFTGVRLVEPLRNLEQDTDLGPTLVGAPGVWSGASTATGMATRGEGVVLGVLDSGINFEHESFAGIEAKTGHVHANPLGTGTYLGSCAPGGLDEGRCNDKLIGAYDFVHALCMDESNPCGALGTWFDEASAEDSNGHGTHVASTAAGNAIDASVGGSPVTVPVSGVANHANIVAFDICYTRVSDGRGWCPNISSVQAIEQAIEDGVAGVLSFSIGGGAEPWSDSVSLAFLAAVEAGMLPSASAGNSGPGAATLGHVEPWVLTVGASTHGRSGFEMHADVTRGDGAPAPTNVPMRHGSAGGPITGDIDAPVAISPGYALDVNVGNDGCLVDGVSPYAEGQFTGRVVVIRRGTCAFSEKAKNAEDAGAVAVLIANNTGTNEIVTPGATPPVPDIPVFGVSQNSGLAIRTADAEDVGPGDTMLFISAAPVAIPATADVMGSFSSRGPSGFDLVKPDLAAPGVAILAAYIPGSQATGLLNGTSMAQPHNAGSAILLRALNPTWTPMQVKSSLMMTTAAGVLKEDGVTPTDAWDRGSGRLDVAAASAAGLIMDESTIDMLAANPYDGGDPGSLNLASLANRNCVGVCQFQRSVRSSRAGVIEWSLQVVGLPEGAASVSPSQFSVGPLGSAVIEVSVDSAQLPQEVDTFGELLLTPSDPSVPMARMPIIVRPAAPDINVPIEVGVTIDPDSVVETTFEIANLGNPTLEWQFVTGEFEATLLDSASSSSGNLVQYLPQVNVGIYVAQPFRMPANGNIATLKANGFVLPGGVNLGGPGGVASAVHFAVYADDGGKPSGDPEDGSEPLWRFDTELLPPAVPAGVDLGANGVGLDLAAAGAPALDLDAGLYWLVVYPSLQGDGTGSDPGNPLWAWRASPSSTMLPEPLGIVPSEGETWGSIGRLLMSAHVAGTLQCGAPWLSTDIESGSLGVGGVDTVTATIDTTGMPPGSYSAVLCVSTLGTDPDEPLVFVPVTLTIMGDDDLIFEDDFEL